MLGVCSEYWEYGMSVCYIEQVFGISGHTCVPYGQHGFYIFNILSKQLKACAQYATYIHSMLHERVE